MNDKMLIVLVYSTSHAMRLEKLLNSNGIACKLIPVPRHLSSDCGICLQISGHDEINISQIIEQSGIEIEGIYPC